MRIPVLVTLPAQEPLRESATASLERRTPKIPIGAATLPAGFAVDETFPAVPLGAARRREMSPAETAQSVSPNVSESFIVRGSIEASSIDEIPKEMDGKTVFADPQIAPFVTCGGSPPVGDASLVANHLNVSALAARGLDGADVAVAIMDTGVNLQHLKSRLGHTPRFDAANSWTPAGGATLPGFYPLDHGTMCAFDVLIAAPNATILDFPILATSAPGGAVSGRTLSVALQAYSALLSSWAVAFAPGGAAKYKALVVNNSWGMFHPSWDFPVGHPGRYIDNPNHPFMGLLSVLARAGTDILFAAGNCGAPCADGRCQGRTTGTIMGASASADVLTLAGCDTTGARVGYSSQGPSIAGMPQQKPDLTAYTHFLGSEAFGAGSPDSGTSAACPVASGCVAALRTKLSPAAVPPPNLFAQLRTTAKTPPGVNPWDSDYGFGIIDPVSAASSLGV